MRVFELGIELEGAGRRSVAARPARASSVDLAANLVGDGGAIRFTSAEPPAPGSTEVYWHSR